MGIKSEFEEVCDLWKGNWLFRALAMVSLFIAVGNLASLSDAIFQVSGLYTRWHSVV